jgi:hydroxymethylbilane synthase
MVAALERAGIAAELVIVHAAGDRHPDRPTAALGVGAFVKDLEIALLDRCIDVAVHSAKDLPTASPSGLTLGAFLPRGDPRDALVTRDGTGLASLPAGAVIGTDSPRRRAFLLAARPDLAVGGMRGNVDTRLRKLAEGQVDGLLVAASGLARLGLDHRAAERLDPAVMLPAVGQGAIVAQVLSDAFDLRARLAAVDHLPTRAEVEAERAFLAALGGGCQRPIAALGRCDGRRLVLDGAVLDASGTRIVRERVEGDAASPSEAGAALARRLLALGADRLLVEVAR